MAISKEQEFLISRFDDPDLTADERHELDVLLQDPAAQAVLEEYRQVDAVLAKWPTAGKNYDVTAFTRQVNERLDRIERRAGSGRRAIWRYLAPVAAAAAVMIVVLPQWNRSGESGGPAGGSDLSAVATNDAAENTGSVVANANEAEQPLVPRMQVVLQEPSLGAIAASQRIVKVQLARMEVTSATETVEDNGSILCFGSAAAEPRDRARQRGSGLGDGYL